MAVPENIQTSAKKLLLNKDEGDNVLRCYQNNLRHSKADKAETYTVYNAP